MNKKGCNFIVLILAIQLFFTNHSTAQTGKWVALHNLPPHANMGVCLLMTNGTVICKSSAGPGEGTGWDRLTPDASGSYINGTWDSIASMNNDRLFFSSQVLPSGKVYVAGGEYGPGGTNGEVYDPVANTWTMCDTIPAGWNIYDGNSEILYDGTVLEGPQIGSVWSYNILIWSPVTNAYTVEPNSIYNHDEAEWVKMPDSSVLFVGIASQNANRYIPQMATWVTDAGTPGALYDPYGEEAGCGFMLPNGKAIFFGATPYNCIYTPSGNATPGTWASADSFPQINGTYMGQPDASGAMMVNGHILLAVSPIGTNVNEFNTPAYFLEYDYVTNTFTQVKDTIPGMGGDSIPYIACYQTQMLDLPDGNVLLSISQTGGVVNQYYIYEPGSKAIAQGKPTINTITPKTCVDYQITGKLFNGISEGAAYGDDWQASTNWPIVRLTNGTTVYYAKTSNWNRIGAVQTDSLEDTAYFKIPAIPNGTYSLVVVVNGFASNPVLFTTFGAGITQTGVLCNGQSNGTATANGTNGVAPYTYQWQGGATTSTISNLSTGTYSVVVTSAAGCSASATISITQPAPLVVKYDSVNVNGSGPCNGQALVIVTGGSSPYTYSWSPGGQTTKTITGQCAGTYCCQIADANGCTGSTCVHVYNTTGIDNLTTGSGGISVYPNPNNGVFTLSFNNSGGITGSQTIEIYNMLGERIYSQAIVHPSSFIVNLSNQPNGVYLYRVISAESSAPIGEGKIILAR